MRDFRFFVAHAKPARRNDGDFLGKRLLFRERNGHGEAMAAPFDIHRKANHLIIFARFEIIIP